MMPLRLGVFVGLVAAGWAHMIHEVVLKGGTATPQGRTSLRCWVSAFACYAAGFGFLLTRFPERLKPGAFDIWVGMIAFPPALPVH
eukprot:scaffold148044_cov16-Prasinocladus_malaysianus.AAC.1